MKKGINIKVRIDSETAGLIEESCRYREINVEEFVEEAIMEKLELEEIRGEFREENGVEAKAELVNKLYYDGPDYNPKKKH